MTDSQIITKVNEVLAEEFEIDVEIISPEISLMECLDLDSLDLVDVVVLIDTNFGITLVGQDFIDIKTFQNFYDLIIQKLNGKNA